MVRVGQVGADRWGGVVLLCVLGFKEPAGALAVLTRALRLGRSTRGAPLPIPGRMLHLPPKAQLPSTRFLKRSSPPPATSAPALHQASHTPTSSHASLPPTHLRLTPTCIPTPTISQGGLV